MTQCLAEQIDAEFILCEQYIVPHAVRHDATGEIDRIIKGLLGRLPPYEFAGDPQEALGCFGGRHCSIISGGGVIPAKRRRRRITGLARYITR
jgi:hypothetical protein